MPLDLCVRCPNEDCDCHQEPIPLLFASLGRTADGRVGWPEDGTELYLACPACRRVSVHSQADARDFPEENQSAAHSGKVWIRVALLCGSEGCNTPAEFHVLLNQASNNQLASELQTKLDRTHWTGFLPCGHQIAPVQPNRWYFDRPQFGRLWGYNPMDPRWAFLPIPPKRWTRTKKADPRYIPFF